MSLKKTVKATKQQSGNRCFSTKNALRNGFRYSRSFSKYQTSSSCPPLQPLACFSGPLWCMLGQDLAPAAEAPSKPCGRRKARSSWSAQPLGISIYRPKSACSAGQVRAMAFYSQLILFFPLGAGQPTGTPLGCEGSWEHRLFPSSSRPLPQLSAFRHLSC